jgi:DNA-binding transcriptional ArsR family regulator
MLQAKLIKKIRKLISPTDHDFAQAFKVLGDINRYRIFHILSSHSGISVGNVAKILNISLPLTSIHLKVLSNNKLVLKEKEGKKIYPKLNLKNPLVRAFIEVIMDSTR